MCQHPPQGVDAALYGQIHYYVGSKANGYSQVRWIKTGNGLIPLWVIWSQISSSQPRFCNQMSWKGFGFHNCLAIRTVHKGDL